MASVGYDYGALAIFEYLTWLSVTRQTLKWTDICVTLGEQFCKALHMSYGYTQKHTVLLNQH